MLIAGLILTAGVVTKTADAATTLTGAELFATPTASFKKRGLCEQALDNFQIQTDLTGFAFCETGKPVWSGTKDRMKRRNFEQKEARRLPRP